MGIARAKRWVATLFRRNLTLLGRWYGTNKAAGHQMYTPMYHRHLAHLRRQSIRLLEIGIGGYDAGLQSGGSSLRMWRTWMPKSRIVGLDLDPRDFGEPRVTTCVGDQTDRAFLRELVTREGPFDVVIDDGSHMSDHIRTSFETIFPMLNAGAIYVIEDLHCSYDPTFGGGPPGTPGTSVEMLKELLDSPTIGGDVRAVHVYPKIAFLERR